MVEKALLIVDFQNDFAHPSGSLYVAGAEECIPVINHSIKMLAEDDAQICASMDWHPRNHVSFEQWPPHCVQYTWGAKLHDGVYNGIFGLRLPWILYKGQLVDSDQYSAFHQRTGGQPNRLERQLKVGFRRKEVKKLFVCGLATDYCVKATVLDGLKRGFEIVVIEGGIKAVNVNPGDGEKAIEEMKDAGARFI